MFDYRGRAPGDDSLLFCFLRTESECDLLLRISLSNSVEIGPPCLYLLSPSSLSISSVERYAHLRGAGGRGAHIGLGPSFQFSLIWDED